MPPVAARTILWRQLRGFGVLLLLIATAVALVSGDRVDAAAIAVVLILNVAIGFITELRARRAMEALRRLQTHWAVVIRDGRSTRIEARGLAVGDIVELEAGNTVPADARLLTAVELRVSEATLTGESAPVQKADQLSLPEDTTLADRRNMVFGSTTVVAGRGIAVVVATGEAMEVGRIGTLVRGIAEETTPLERRLSTLSNQLTLVALVVGAVVGGMAWLGHRPLAMVIQLALAMAVAAVPEGLPAVVTITLAVGMRRMARRHALIRRMTAVETLGATTVVCTDKTGTLTAGEQTMTAVWLPDQRFAITGSGYTPVGEFRRGDNTVAAVSEPGLCELLRAGALANRASLRRAPDGWEALGDPTEIALLVAAEKAGIDRGAQDLLLPELAEVPFSSDRMYMATFHRDGDRTLAMVKGAAVRVLALCSRVRAQGGDAPLDDVTRARVVQADGELAGNGLRVLAIATGSVPGRTEADLVDLCLLGLVGITDPPAPEARDAVERLRSAGIETVMLTGDQQRTAAAVGRELGITTIVPRITAEQKLEVIRGLRSRGEIVAMLGDGVNDAAALRQADVGIAMGGRGTDVAKEASGVVLTDDRFATVAAAVEEGRVAFDNIRKAVLYLVSCNLAEIVTIVGAGAIGLPLPVTPLQILWLNLVTDSLPALALAMEPADANVMQRRPRDPREHILTRRALLFVTWYAVLIAGSTIAALLVARSLHPDQPARIVTMSFTTLALAQLFHLGNARRLGEAAARRWARRNGFALLALAITVSLQFAASTLPGFSSFIDAVPLRRQDWLVVIGFALIPAVVGRVATLMRARH